MHTSCQTKKTTLTFLAQIAQNRFRIGNSKNQCRDKNQYPRDTTCTNFQAKRTTFTFLAQIWAKIDLGLEIHKTNVGMCRCSFKTNNFDFFDPNCPKMDFEVEISII